MASSLTLLFQVNGCKLAASVNNLLKETVANFYESVETQAILQRMSDVRYDLD